MKNYTLQQVLKALENKGFIGIYSNEDVSSYELQIGFTTIIATVEEYKGIATINGENPKQWFKTNLSHILAN